MSEVDWSDDQSTPAVPSKKRSSPFDVKEVKRSSPFDAQEKQTSTHAGAETFEVEDECYNDGVAAVSTNLSVNYKQIFWFPDRRLDQKSFTLNLCPKKLRLR
jgi:hypothetical protein